MAAIDGIGLLKPLYLARRRWKIWRIARDEAPKGVDGVPVPPPRLRFLTGNHPDLEAFVRGGRNTAAAISGQLDEIGRPIAEMGAILDFGCGCGRVARNWAALDPVAVSGCDYNTELIEWCGRNLTYMESRRNGLEPPLSFEADAFDFAYAISIFTHFPVDLQRRWVDELARVVRPGGALLITLHGESYARQFLERTEREEFDAGRPVVLREGLAGTNGCMSLTPRSWVERSLLAAFDLASFWPQQQVPEVGQDMYLAIKR